MTSDRRRRRSELRPSRTATGDTTHDAAAIALCEPIAAAERASDPGVSGRSLAGRPPLLSREAVAQRPRRAAEPRGGLVYGVLRAANEPPRQITRRETGLPDAR